jgi:hypothetical protein
MLEEMDVQGYIGCMWVYLRWFDLHMMNHFFHRRCHIHNCNCI